MVETRELYLVKVLPLFHKEGIKKVTMDYISSHLGISKKTLYKYFKDKDDIVSTLVKMEIDNELSTYTRIFNESNNAIEETFTFSKFLIGKLNDSNPKLFFDLERYHPEAWEIFHRHKRVEIYNYVKVNIERGKKEGLYRENLNSEIIAKLYAEKVETLTNDELFPRERFSFEVVFSEMIRYHLKGIVNNVGYDYLMNSELVLKQKV